jgi:phosphotransferase system enzyme I (PtsI)
MFPLVSGIEELDQALALLEEAKSECRKNNHPFDNEIKAGTMIEVPSAAVIADLLAEKSSFFSIGTNDLVQYTLAVDRRDEQESYLARPSHPAIIRLIKNTVDASLRHGIKTAICGEMAGDPVYTPLLLGLGFDEFSMSASSIPQIKSIIRSVSIDACRELADKVINAYSHSESIMLINDWAKEFLPSKPEQH